MRELGLEFSYDRGADPLMDLFRRERSLRGKSIGTCVSRDQFWLVEQFVGPDSVLDEVEAIRDSEAEVMTASTRGANRHTAVLERTPSSVVIYQFMERLHACESVYALAARRLDLGFIIHAHRRGNTNEMRVLTRSEENIEAFYERLKESLADGISVEFSHLNGVSQWNVDSLASVTMPQEQRETLRAAVEHGYYETPRAVTVEELADRLGAPQSTVSYRLRQAESHLAKGYFEFDDGTVEGHATAER